MKYLVLTFLVSLSVNSLAQEQKITKEKWHWDNDLSGSAKVFRTSDALYISGAVARDITPEGIMKLYQALDRS